MVKNNETKHGIPAIMSMFVPGMGQFVKGHNVKAGIAFFGTIIGLMALVLPGLIVWLWNVRDAYNSNKKL